MKLLAAPGQIEKKSQKMTSNFTFVKKTKTKESFRVQFYSKKKYRNDARLYFERIDLGLNVGVKYQKEMARCYEPFLKLGASISGTGRRFFIERKKLWARTRELD